jgi:hypothetical protein
MSIATRFKIGGDYECGIFGNAQTVRAVNQIYLD